MSKKTQRRVRIRVPANVMISMADLESIIRTTDPGHFLAKLSVLSVKTKIAIVEEILITLSADEPESIQTNPLKRAWLYLLILTRFVSTFERFPSKPEQGKILENFLKGFKHPFNFMKSNEEQIEEIINLQEQSLQEAAHKRNKAFAEATGKDAYWKPEAFSPKSPKDPRPRQPRYQTSNQKGISKWFYNELQKERQFVDAIEGRLEEIDPVEYDDLEAIIKDKPNYDLLLDEWDKYFSTHKADDEIHENQPKPNKD